MESRSSEQTLTLALRKLKSADDTEGKNCMRVLLSWFLVITGENRFCKCFKLHAKCFSQHLSPGRISDRGSAQGGTEPSGKVLDDLVTCSQTMKIHSHKEWTKWSRIQKAPLKGRSSNIGKWAKAALGSLGAQDRPSYTLIWYTSLKRCFMRAVTKKKPLKMYRFLNQPCQAQKAWVTYSKCQELAMFFMHRQLNKHTSLVGLLYFPDMNDIKIKK